MNILKRPTGFNLLELLLVLAVVAAILLAGFKRYQVYQQQRDLAAVSYNVQTLFQALDQYYQANCKNDLPYPYFKVNLDKLTNVTNKLLRANIVANFTDYQVAANYLNKKTIRGNRDIYQLQVQVTLNVPINTIGWYQQRLQATTVSGKTLTWVRMPGYSLETTDSHLWIMNAGLREFKENSLVNGKDSGLSDTSCDY